MSQEALESEALFRKDFFFRRRHGQLDWHKLCRLDLQQVVRDVDVDALQDNIDHVTFADITEQDMYYLNETNFIQLFRLCQLMIEYLINSQNFILRREAKAKEYTSSREAEILELKKQLLLKDKKIAKYHQKCRALMLTNEAYQRTRGAVNTDILASDGDLAGAKDCRHCAFRAVNLEKMEAHYRRRHPGKQYGEQTPAPSPPRHTVIVTETNTNTENIRHTQLLEETKLEIKRLLQSPQNVREAYRCPAGPLQDDDLAEKVNSLLDQNKMLQEQLSEKQSRTYVIHASPGGVSRPCAFCVRLVLF
jgi:hypothetical protein